MSSPDTSNPAPLAKANHRGRPSEDPPGGLARILALSATELQQLADRATESYCVYPLIRGTKKRWIEAPLPDLKRTQQRLLTKVLYRLNSTPFAHGFVPGRSIVTNAQQHVGRSWVVTLDLKDFFPSVTAKAVAKALEEIDLVPDQRRLLLQLVTRNERLPQGAPTSPHLANLVTRDLDHQLASRGGHLGWTYTRYADDLAFSGDGDFKKLLPQVEEIVHSEGFCLARHKTRIRSRHQRQLVTGMVVNHRVRLPKPKRRLLRAMLHGVIRGSTTDWNDLATQVVAGHLAFAAFVDPQTHRGGCQQLRRLLQPTPQRSESPAPSI